MVVAPAPGAEAYLPARRSLSALRDAAPGCRGCDLYRHATQVVFGDGPASASLVLVAEMPGDAEDLQGRPFVGPAGKLLDQVLLAAGVPRLEVYITNAVKHFRFLAGSGRRLHKSPAAEHITACRPWIEAQLSAIAPRVTVCLGATALRAVLGRPTTIASLRGRPLTHPLAGTVVASLHPAAILRMPSPAARHQALAGLVADLKLARRLSGGGRTLSARRSRRPAPAPRR